MNWKKISLCASVLALPSLAYATPPHGYSEAEIDTLVHAAMETFHIPGMSVGVIKDGHIVHLKGYGVRDITKKGKVNPKTMFSIASTSKAFTGAALAILVDEGKIKWEDKVTDYIPEFQMYDPWVTREFTIRDLMIHNSGLGRGTGDLMFWPSTDFTRTEVIANLRHLKPTSSFREKHSYSNLMYIIAGEIVPAVTGMSLEDFTDTRIMKPLGMRQCTANRTRLKHHKNIATPHILQDGKLITVARMKPVHEELLIAAPGGIECSAQSLLKWLAMHLSEGKIPNGKALISAKGHEKLLQPQTTRKPNTLERDWFNTHFKSYGIGWSLQDAHGYKWAAHAGGLHGMQSYVGLLPEKEVGIVVLTNQQSGEGLRAIFYGLMTSYISDENIDWVERFKTLQALQTPVTLPDFTTNIYMPTTPLADYVGTYRDVWFGDITISKNKNGLRVKSARSPRLTGKLIAYKDNLFVAKWDDRTLEADAYLQFSDGPKGMLNTISMKAVSPVTDFSFDFQDLDFKRVK
ncbi:MAG: serine hydrolase [Robiginitomaculum sp.]|nr:MAG: serine hydrolase [Robiginitomaculum sp.]